MIRIEGKNLNLENVYKIAFGDKVELSPHAKKKIAESRAYIDKKLKSKDAVYGVNTGFGAAARVRIDDKKLAQLQKNLIRSHSTGVGKPFSLQDTRAIMALRANALACGHSGVRVEVIEKILEFLNEDIIPYIPQQGSVGASGDLAPLSHLALAIIGEGYVWKDGKKFSTQKLLATKKIRPLELEAKEGLSMINGCQVMTAVGLLNLYRARRLCWMADLAGAMSVEALLGSRSAFDPLISSVRPHPGESKTARNLLKILGKRSKISDSHENCDRVQDSYSLRCMPQVHGAAKDALRNALEVLEREANSATDNPLVFHKDDKILSGGNFHGQPVAFQMDFSAIAVSALASISERRLEKLTNSHTNGAGLPMFAIPDSGLNSGMMIVQVSAASLVSENKVLCHPASADSIPTNADKEDHVSMGTIAARKLGQVVKNSENVIAMEILAACQGLDLRKPLEPAAGVQAAFQYVRKHVGFAKEDRFFAEDIWKIADLIRDDSLVQVLDKSVGDLEF